MNLICLCVLIVRKKTNPGGSTVCSLCCKPKRIEDSRCQDPGFSFVSAVLHPRYPIRQQISLKRMMSVVTCGGNVFLLSSPFNLLPLSLSCLSPVFPFPCDCTSELKVAHWEKASFPIPLHFLPWSNTANSHLLEFTSLLHHLHFPSPLHSSDHLTPPLTASLSLSFLVLCVLTSSLPKKDSICLDVSGKSSLKGAAKSLGYGLGSCPFSPPSSLRLMGHVSGLVLSSY